MFDIQFVRILPAFEPHFAEYFPGGLIQPEGFVLVFIIKGNGSIIIQMGFSDRDVFFIHCKPLRFKMVKPIALKRLSNLSAESGKTL